MCLLWASSLQTLGAVISRHPVTWVRLSRYDRGWTADALLGELAIFLQVFDGVEVRASIHNVDFLRLHLQAPDLFSLEDYLCRRMAFCQLGLAPRAVVSTLKTEGQRGDLHFSIVTSPQIFHMAEAGACIPGSLPVRRRRRRRTSKDSVWRQADATNESDAVASAKHGCAFSPFFSKEGRSFSALQ
uniref:uncharacterized protein LOC124049557 isoform X4 n=1 Tax=Scatophagus argus TaxID=75038 RepID=UPI001ED820E1|nr:uncharacterized protein LOC124049557 isoform X4 [Scatophagus argus]